MTDIGPNIGKVGLWSMEMRFGDSAQADETAAEVDELGFGAIWIPGGIDDAVLGDVERLLGVTKRVAIATGIINIWKQEAADVAAWFKGLSDAHKSRVLLGIGVSHGPMIGEAWEKPLAKTRGYIDSLEAAGMPLGNVCVAALGPKMLQLSGERTAGAHPYLVTPEHSARAREILGPGKLVAPEQGAVLESDPAKAREMARGALTYYRELPNYRNNWKRLGFSEDDIENASDALIDGLFAWGGPGAVAERVKAHHDAGADHVCLQVITGDQSGDFSPLRTAYRELAKVLI